MRRVRLGARGPEVSCLCFGTLTLGRLQRDLPAEEGAELICYAAGQGIDLVDTAELYGTYPHVGLALKQCPGLKVSTKTYAHDADGAARSLERAQRELDREYIDLFMLHEQESLHTLRGHEAALRYFAQKKREGVIGAIGISTHCVAAVQAGAAFGKEFGGLDVIHPLINREGLGIADGTRAEMEEACAAAKAEGIGIMAMKALGGGHLIEAPQSAFAYAMAAPFIDAVAVGMQSRAEVDYNVAVWNRQSPDARARAACARAPRRMMVHDWCTGCGLCESRCGQRAISIQDGQALIDSEVCVRCGYCAADCPEFCIKVI